MVPQPPSAAAITRASRSGGSPVTRRGCNPARSAVERERLACWACQANARAHKGAMVPAGTVHIERHMGIGNSSASGRYCGSGDVHFRTRLSTIRLPRRKSSCGICIIRYRGREKAGCDLIRFQSQPHPRTYHIIPVYGVQLSTLRTIAPHPIILEPFRLCSRRGGSDFFAEDFIEPTGRPRKRTPKLIYIPNRGSSGPGRGMKLLENKWQISAY